MYSCLILRDCCFLYNNGNGGDVAGNFPYRDVLHSYDTMTNER